MQPSETDYRAIEQLLYRYAWMVDRRKWELMDEVFSADGTIDYASTGGPGAMPYRAALEWLDRALKPWPFNLHHITNIAVDIDGDRGEPRRYFTAPMGRPFSRWRAGCGHQCRLLSRHTRAHTPGLAHRGALLRHDRPDRPSAVGLHDPGVRRGRTEA